MLKGHRDLKVFQLAYNLAMEIFNLSKAFRREETYSLTDQIRRDHLVASPRTSRRDFGKGAIQIIS
jgi:23S rRNA-intervening sequence protein